jgi:hypothetical protein
MRYLSIMILIFSLFVLTWCAEQLDQFNDSVNTVRESEEYQQVKQSVNSWVKYVGDKANEFIENNTWARQVVDTANQTFDRVAEETVRIKEQAQETVKDFWTKAEEEAIRQYEILKEETKSSVKEVINKKVDDAFDKI